MCLVFTCQEYAFPSTVEPHTIDGVKSFCFFWWYACCVLRKKETQEGFVGWRDMTSSSFNHESSCMFQRAEIFKWMKMLV